MYSSGWAKCMTPGCGKNWRPEGDYKSRGPIQRKSEVGDLPFVEGEYQAIPSRSISEDVCKRYHYQIGKVPKDYPVKTGALAKMKGKLVHIENYYDGSKLVAQKLRDRNKNFAIVGDAGKLLFGRHCCPGGSKLLVVTEGAIDAMSYAEVRARWPSVSIPNGAESAKKAIKANLEYLESFEKVVFAFDNDEAGKQAIEDVKGILSPGKMFVAGALEYKDYNDALKEGDFRAVMNSVMNAEEVRPDGIVDIDDVIEEASKPIEWGLPWFLPILTKKTYGRRYGELYGFGAGTGVGKTDVLTEQIAFDISILDQPVGALFLEQKPKETAQRIAGKIANKQFHVPDGDWTTEELTDTLKTLRGKITFYDSFGQTEWERVKHRIRHMNISKGIRIFYIDHLTAMADTTDEKGSLEQITKEMAGLADELGLIIHFVSHLSTPEGKPHEEGGRVAIRHFKGSRSIGFWAYFLFGLERDQQSEDEEERHTTTFRVLKDRYTGQATGHTFPLSYNAETGRISASDSEELDYGDSRNEGF